MNQLSIAFLLSIMGTFSVHAGNCLQWQYSSLSLTSKATIEDSVLKKVSTFVLWEEPSKYAMWQNNELLTGTIKNQKLTEYFGVKKVHAPSILNKLGMDGWEAYGFHTIQESKTDQTKQWQLKKCVS